MKTMPTKAIATAVMIHAVATGNSCVTAPLMPMNAPSIRKLSLRKIDDLDGVENQQQAKRDKSVDAPKRKAVDDELAHEGSRIRFP